MIKRIFTIALILSFVALVYSQEKLKDTLDVLDANPYEGFRNMAFSVTPNDLEIALLDEKEVFGIIVDWNLGNAVATVVAYITGDASLYLSTGQIFIGGYAHENIVTAAKDLIKSSISYLDFMEFTNTQELPAENIVRFYCKTTSGIYMHEENVVDLANESNVWNNLFRKVNIVISEYKINEMENSG